MTDNDISIPLSKNYWEMILDALEGNLGPDESYESYHSPMVLRSKIANELIEKLKAGDRGCSTCLSFNGCNYISPDVQDCPEWNPPDYLHKDNKERKE